MQEEAQQGQAQDPGVGAQEQPNVAAPEAAESGGSEGLGQQQPQQQEEEAGAAEFVAPEGAAPEGVGTEVGTEGVGTEGAASSTSPPEQESAFDPSITMRPEDMWDLNVAEPPVDPGADQARGPEPNTGDIGGLSEDPGQPGSVDYSDPRQELWTDEAEEPGAADTPTSWEEARSEWQEARSEWQDARSEWQEARSEWRESRWTEEDEEPGGGAAETIPWSEESSSEESEEGRWTEQAEPGVAEPGMAETIPWSEESSSEQSEESWWTEQAEPAPQESVFAPPWISDPDRILEDESVPADTSAGPTAVEQDTEPLGTEGAAGLPNLADHLDPQWPVFENLSAQELLGVQELLSDPSTLSDPGVLNDLSPHQMQAMIQAFSGYYNPSGSEEADQQVGPLIEPEAPAEQVGVDSEGEGVDPYGGGIPFLPDEDRDGMPDATDPDSPDQGSEWLSGTTIGEVEEGEGFLPEASIWFGEEYGEGDELPEVPEEAAAAGPPVLEDMIDPEWPVLENLSSQDLLQVQEVLRDPSSLSDPEVLNELSPHQMQAMVQAFSGYLSASAPEQTEPEVEPTDVIPDWEDTWEWESTGDDVIIEEFPDLWGDDPWWESTGDDVIIEEIPDWGWGDNPWLDDLGGTLGGTWESTGDDGILEEILDVGSTWEATDFITEEFPDPTDILSDIDIF